MNGQSTPSVLRRVPPPGALPIPAPGELIVWWATVDDVDPAAFEALRSELDDDTYARINAMVRDQDRRRGIVAHGLLRRLVGATTGILPSDVAVQRICATCGAADHGKPALLTRGGARPPVQFNLAHSGSVVAVVLAGPTTEVGIDVEAIQTDFDWLPARRHVFTDDEWARTAAAANPTGERFALWARKEAAAKTTGHGLAIDLVHCQIDEASAPLGELDADWDAGARRARLTAPESVYELLVVDFAPGTATAGAVATRDRGGPLPRVSVVRADLSR